MVRLAVDLRMFDGRMHGLARYTYATLEEMLSLRPSWEFLALERPGALADLGRSHSNLRRLPVSARPFSLREHVELPWLLRRHQPHLYHATSIAVSWFLGVPTVATLPDLTPYRFPRRGFERAWFRWFYRPFLRGARRILVFSRHTAEDAAATLRLPLDRFVVAPLGIGEALRQPVAPEARAEVLARLGLSGTYVACLGNPKPHKNVWVVAEAFRRHDLGVRLLLACPPTPGVRATVEGVPAIRLVPHLEEGDLPAVLQGAAAVVVPSLYEGFGLPAAEAMAAGTPVVTSDATSLPEVVGDCGIYFDPRSPDDLAEKLRHLLGDPALQASLRERGLARAAAFTWTRTAEIHLAAYEEALGG